MFNVQEVLLCEVPYMTVWGRAEGTASYLPFRGYIRRGKLTTFSIIDEMFPRRYIGQRGQKSGPNICKSIP